MIDKPEVTTNIQSPYRVIEGETTSLECIVSAANPNTSISWIWLNANGNILHTGQTYIMRMIQRNQSGSYNCSAKNSVGMSVGVTIFVDVQCKYNCCKNRDLLFNRSFNMLVCKF